MKLYIIPIQNECNAKCFFCITKYRKETGWGETINLGDLAIVKSLRGLDKIEITGGGEPTLHPQINEIIGSLDKDIFTQLYTNGLLLKRLDKTSLAQLDKLCISRSHYDVGINQKIMGIKSEDEEIKRLSKLVDIKLSAVMCQVGINSEEEIFKYLQWATSVGAKEVVFRRLFDFNYPGTIKKVAELDWAEIIKKMKKKYEVTAESEEKINFLILGRKVEIELRSCDCELTNLVLRPNGKIYVGWGKKEYTYQV